MLREWEGAGLNTWEAGLTSYTYSASIATAQAA
jgi:hypothetical protein